MRHKKRLGGSFGDFLEYGKLLFIWKVFRTKNLTWSPSSISVVDRLDEVVLGSSLHSRHCHHHDQRQTGSHKEA